MDSPPNVLPPYNEQIFRQLKQLKIKAQHSDHRFLVVISGDEQWVFNTLAYQLKLLSKCHTLVVTNRSLDVTGDHCASNKLNHHLGSEIEQIVWDGFSGINPDGLGAASGLLLRGGLFFLLLPSLNKLTQKPDLDYLRMCAEEDELKSCGTRFLKRLTRLLTSDPDVYLIQQNAAITHLPEENFSPTELSQAFTPKPAITLPTQDQIQTIKAIKSVAKGHRKRPLVIYADRGRGKSSALGLAAAEIVNEYALNVLITAPSRKACDAAFKHAETIRPEFLALKFIAPDELVSALPSCHLLLVDEAAAIPSTLLKQMLCHYPRIVFASTIHGYEGNGQGFAVRFRQELDSQTPQWKSLYLNQAIRWAENDPLERWTSDLLMLNAQLPSFEKSHDDLKYLLSTAKTRWITQDELARDDDSFSQITALLVLAHYQTSPSDIRMILDHPKIHLAVVEGQGDSLANQSNHSKKSLLGVILMIEEGGVDDEALTQAIIEGRRRPRGQLVPQALVGSTACREFLVHKTLRIMRITIHPDLTNQGLGSTLVTAAKHYSEQKKFDSLSTSFGITPNLINFWRKNSFNLLKVGTHRDGASGTQSAFMLRPLSQQSEHLLNVYTFKFKKDFLAALSKQYRNLESENIYAILKSLSLNHRALNSNELSQIHAYSNHFRTFEESVASLVKGLLNCFADQSIRNISTAEARLLIMRLLQGRSENTCIQNFHLTGKKQLNSTLRKQSRRLFDSYTNNGEHNKH